MQLVQIIKVITLDLKNLISLKINRRSLKHSIPNLIKIIVSLLDKARKINFMRVMLMWKISRKKRDNIKIKKMKIREQ